MKINPRLLLLAAFATVALAAQYASAVTTTLTGGDATDGLMLSGTLAGAIFTNSNAGGATTTALSLQTYTLNPYTTTGTTVSNITASGNISIFSRDTFVAAVTPASAGFTNPTTPSANDTALLNAVNSGILFASGTNTLTLTIGGLTAGGSYNVAFLTCATGYGARTETLSINGGAAEVINIANVNAVYATTNLAVASATGTITAVFAQGGGGTLDGAFTNAAIVTRAVPEPTTWTLVAAAGVGGLMYLRRRPDRSTA